MRSTWTFSRTLVTSMESFFVPLVLFVVFSHEGLARHQPFYDNEDLESSNNTILSSRVCKPGPPLVNIPRANRKCLVIGDSVSIGYTPWVKSSLQEVCQVYHAPWDTTDGGALDTKYAVKCLHLFLVSNLLEEIRYDVILFNFGLHDANFDFDNPEEYTDVKTYRKNLLLIKDMLQATGSHVGYVLTTPVPFNITANDRVKRFNAVAREVMDSGRPVQVADLYHWVVLVCGEPPYSSCGIADKQPSPHYTKHGYRYLSVMVTALITDLIQPSSAQHKTALRAVKQESSHHQTTNTLSCKDSHGQTVTKCPDTMTCSPSLYSESHWGCCPLPNAVSCTDGKHCCPAGYECDPSCNVSSCRCSKSLRMMLKC